MHSLVVFSHPDPASLTAHAARSIASGLTAAGGTAEVADLHAEGFDPRITLADLEVTRGTGDVPADVRREQERVERADALVLVHPVYWWNVPALMKGWIDRVVQNGWAYDDGRRGSAGAAVLTTREIHLVGLAEATADVFERHGYTEAMRVGIDHGIFDYCDATVTSSRIVHWAGEDPGRVVEEAAGEVVAAVGGARV